MLALAGLAACGSRERAPEPVAPLRVATQVRYQLGGPLRGPSAPGDVPPEEALLPERALAVRLVAVEAFAIDEPRLVAVADRAKLVVLEHSAERALSATPRALAAARVGEVDAAEDLVQRVCLSGTRPGRVVRDARACLPAGVSVVLELLRDEPWSPRDEEGLRRAAAARRQDVPVRSRDEPPRSRVALVVARRKDGQGLEVALEREDPLAGPEVVALDGPSFRAPEVCAWAAVVPSPFEGDEARELLLVLETSPAPRAPSPLAAVHEEALAEARRQLVAQAQAARALAAPLAPPPAVPDLGATLRALNEPRVARRALYVLALATGARTAEELAVSVDDFAFAPVASSVAAALWSATRAATAAELGLAVEHATLAACRHVLTAEDVPDDLMAALERRGGAALRLLGSLGGELERARSLDELERLLLAQNVQLLEDASPRVRVRAARWLAPRLDLAGYAPLDALLERRSAVQRIRQRLRGGS